MSIESPTVASVTGTGHRFREQKDLIRMDSLLSIWQRVIYVDLHVGYAHTAVELVRNSLILSTAHDIDGNRWTRYRALLKSLSSQLCTFCRITFPSSRPAVSSGVGGCYRLLLREKPRTSLRPGVGASSTHTKATCVQL